VDDSAWAYGLKKAGYATASDYPKKLLKVINDFELSQYNFPELAFFEEEDTPTQKIDTSKKIEARKTIEPLIVVDSVKMDSVKKVIDTVIEKDTTVIASSLDTATTSLMTVSTSAKDSINSKYIDTIQLSTIKGIISTDTIKNTAPKAMNGIGSIAIEQVKDSAIKIDAALAIDTTNNKKESDIKEANIIDTSKLITKTQNSAAKFEYPKGKFRANQLLAIYATAGSSFLELATTYNIALYKLYNYNDLEETDLVSKDQILYLVPKRKEVSKKVHLVAAGESLYDISQNEGIQLNYLQAYNTGVTDKNLQVGSTLVLFKTNEASKISTAPIKSISTPGFLKRKKNN
jgi:LysM repeat protein